MTRDALLEILNGSASVDSSCTLGRAKNTAGQLVVKGKRANLSVGDHLTIGDHGSGKVAVTDAAQASVRNWLKLGHAGSGRLAVNQGATLQVGNKVDIGYHTGSDGEAFIAGKGSSWRIAAALSIGESGNRRPGGASNLH